MFDMKCHFSHEFATATPFKGKFSDDFKDVHTLKMLTNINVNLTSSVTPFLGGVMNNMSKVKFFTHLGSEVRLTSKFVSSFSL